ncbi:MAG: DUF4252 domain-containing protein [Flavobacteriales bacterium]|nr:DUF4252 domain-containing protein [Flavobacteriales bacterium]
MKKIALILSMIIISSSAFSIASNDSASDKVFKRLKANNTESFSMSLSKSMIDFFDMDLDFNGKEKLITGDFHRGNMMIFKEVKSTNTFLNAFKIEKYELIQNDDIEINLSDDEGDSEAYLYVNRKGSNVSEAHFIIVGDESVTVLSVFGDIKVKNK